MPVSIVMLVKGVLPIDVSSLANCDLCSSNSSLRLSCIGAESSCHGGSKVSGVMVSDIIFFNVILLARWVSPTTVESNTIGSRCPMYSPLWKVRCLLV